MSLFHWQALTPAGEPRQGALAGVKGRFGADWRWDAYYQYGATDSASVQKNVATNLRMAFALDAVIEMILQARVERDPANPSVILTVWGDGYKFADA